MNGRAVRSLLLLLSLSFIVILGAGCKPQIQCELTNFTPDTFPTSRLKLQESVEVSDDKFSQLVNIQGVREGFDTHRFMLLVEPSDVGDVAATIFVNGGEYSMSEYEQGLWYFEPSEQCFESYDYYFQVDCGSVKVWSPGTTHTLGSASSPMTVTSQIWNDVGWFDSGSGLAHTGDGNVEITPEGPARIIVQSMQAQATVEQVRFSPDETADDKGSFALVDLPTLPATLGCGESLEFQITWTAASDDGIDNGTVEIVASWTDPDAPEHQITKSMHVLLAGQRPQ